MNDSSKNALEGLQCLNVMRKKKQTKTGQLLYSQSKILLNE